MCDTSLERIDHRRRSYNWGTRGPAPAPGQVRLLGLPGRTDDPRQVQVGPHPQEFGAVELLLRVGRGGWLEQDELVGRLPVGVGEVVDRAR